MKKIMMVLSVFSSIYGGSVVAESVCQQSLGSYNCQQGSVDHIQFEGSVNLDGTKVINNADVQGGFNGSGAEIGALNVEGSAILNSSKILRGLRIDGNFNANDTQLSGPSKVEGNFVGKHLVSHNSTRVEGAVYCKDCIFNAEAAFYGNVRLIKSTLAFPLKMVAKEAYFTDSSLQDVVVDFEKENVPQVVSLLGNTTIRNITFINQKGTIYISKNSQILGTVKGAEVRHV